MPCNENERQLTSNLEINTFNNSQSSSNTTSSSLFKVSRGGGLQTISPVSTSGGANTAGSRQSGSEDAEFVTWIETASNASSFKQSGGSVGTGVVGGDYQAMTFGNSETDSIKSRLFKLIFSRISNKNYFRKTWSRLFII